MNHALILLHEQGGSLDDGLCRATTPGARDARMLESLLEVMPQS